MYDEINEIDEITSASVPHCAHRVLTSCVGATLHHWDTASVNWDGSVVKSWWCNILAESSVSINQPEKLNGRAVFGSLHSPRSLVV